VRPAGFHRCGFREQLDHGEQAQLARLPATRIEQDHAERFPCICVYLKRLVRMSCDSSQRIQLETNAHAFARGFIAHIGDASRFWSAPVRRCARSACPPFPLLPRFAPQPLPAVFPPFSSLQVTTHPFRLSSALTPSFPFHPPLCFFSPPPLSLLFTHLLTPSFSHYTAPSPLLITLLPYFLLSSSSQLPAPPLTPCPSIIFYSLPLSFCPLPTLPFSLTAHLSLSPDGFVHLIWNSVMMMLSEILGSHSMAALARMVTN